MARVIEESASPHAWRWPICQAWCDRSLTREVLHARCPPRPDLDDRHGEQFFVDRREPLDDRDLGVLSGIDDQPREGGAGTDVVVDDDRLLDDGTRGDRDDDRAVERGVELGEQIRGVDVGQRREGLQGVLVGGHVGGRAARIDARVELAVGEALEIEVADPAVAPDLLGRRRPRHRRRPFGRRHPLVGERPTQGARLISGVLVHDPPAYGRSPSECFLPSECHLPENPARDTPMGGA